jgi:hypothetical protein
MTYHVDVQPDIWTILTAVGTIGAVIAALLGVWYGITAAKRERQRLEDRSAQSDARKIVVICRIVLDVNAHPEPTWRDGIEIVNASPEPILEVRLLHASSKPTVESMRPWYWSPGSGGSSHTQLLLPGQERQFGGRWIPVGGGVTNFETPSNADRGWFMATVTWSDVRNRHWIRRAGEEPVELQQPTVYGEDPIPVRSRDQSCHVITETRALWAQNKRAIENAAAEYEASQRNQEQS